MTGLIVEGGANRTYFAVGVMDALMENKIKADYIGGASAGISNAMNYASNQAGRGLEIALKYVPSKKYCGMRHLFNPKNKSIFNIKHVFNEIPNKLIPYDYSALSHFNGIAEAAVTNIETGKSEYLPVLPNDKSWKTLLASCSLPIVFPIVEIDGKKYMDGGISDSIPFKRAFDMGCDKTIVILSRERSYIKGNSKSTNFSAFFYGKYPNFAKALKNRYKMYNDQRKELFEMEKQNKVFIFEPDDTHDWKRTENNPQKLKAMYDEGYFKATEKMEELKKFFEY